MFKQQGDNLNDGESPQEADGKKDEKKEEKPVDPVVAAMTGRCLRDSRAVLCD